MSRKHLILLRLSKKWARKHFSGPRGAWYWWTGAPWLQQYSLVPFLGHPIPLFFIWPSHWWAPRTLYVTCFESLVWLVEPGNAREVVRVCIAVARIEEVVEWGPATIRRHYCRPSSPVMDPGSLYHISFFLSISFQYLDDWSLGKRDSVLGDLSLPSFDPTALPTHYLWMYWLNLTR